MRKLSNLKPKVSKIDMRRGTDAATKRIAGRPLTRIRERILLRDEYTCQVCGLVSVDLEIDHVVPLHLGGAESDENRQSLCRGCHQLKTEREEKDRGGFMP